MFLLYNLVMEVIFQLTPSRRATSSVMNTCSHFGISTHALTEGDFVPYLRFIKSFHFNSRPHGGRRMTPLAVPLDKCISTHALTEGDGNIYCYIVFGLFQLTPSRRATVSPCSFTPSGIFQLTPSRRATLKERLVLVRQYYFNSRPHGGRLFDRCRVTDQALISTHALTEGDHRHHTWLIF